MDIQFQKERVEKDVYVLRIGTHTVPAGTFLTFLTLCVLMALSFTEGQIAAAKIAGMAPYWSYALPNGNTLQCALYAYDRTEKWECQEIGYNPNRIIPETDTQKLLNLTFNKNG